MSPHCYEQHKQGGTKKLCNLTTECAQEWVNYQCDLEQTSLFTEVYCKEVESVYQKGDWCLKLHRTTANNSFRYVM